MKKNITTPMKKISIKKLTLHTQTLRELVADQLHGVIGGFGDSVHSCTDKICYLR